MAQGPPGVKGACFRLGENPHLDLTKMVQKYGSVFSLMLGNSEVVALNVVNAIQEGVFVIHRIWIRVQVRIGLQAKLRITGLRILRLRVRLRGTRKAK
ncbi:hypothetical protein ACROYT_G011728 [Oculina patagonica]